MSSESPKHALFIQFALVAKALGHADRLELLEHLAQGERSVEILAQRSGLSTANASQHLQQLRRAALVASRRDGKFIIYRLADPAVLSLFAALRQVAERGMTEVDRIVKSYFIERDAMEAVSREELMHRARDGLVTVLDVRPSDEFAASHVPGALNIPLEELELRIGEIDPDQEVIAYCRGAYCVMSFEAVAALRARGFKARRLEDGLPEWSASGFPIETSHT